MYRTLFSRRHEEGSMRLVSFPEDTLGIFYRGIAPDDEPERWCITYNLVDKDGTYYLRTIGSESPEFIDDKELSSTEKKSAWLEGFETLVNDIRTLEDSLPIRPEDADEIWERLKEYHKEIYPD